MRPQGALIVTSRLGEWFAMRLISNIVDTYKVCAAFIHPTKDGVRKSSISLPVFDFQYQFSSTTELRPGLEQQSCILAFRLEIRLE